MNLDEQRLLDRCMPEPNSGCWLWLGGVTVPRRGTPYGTIRRVGERYLSFAHRLAFELWCQPIEPGQVIRHKCDNTYCINPQHLLAGTQADNIKDRDDRHRRAPPKGETNGGAKLSAGQVAEIKLALKNKEPRVSIQVRFGIKKSQLSNIARGVSWGHLK